MEYLTASRAYNDVFDALGNRYRRRVLVALSERACCDGGAVSPAELAIEDEDPDELRTLLHHCHLPKLATKGYLEWDPNGGRIRRGDDFEELEPFLAVILEHGDEPPGDRTGAPWEDS